LTESKQQESSQSPGSRLVRVLQQRPDDSLEVFLNKMNQFDRQFCDMMANGSEFTIRLEIRGQGGRVLQTRVYLDDVGRPQARKDSD